MATWIGVARTNYFRVKDKAAFEAEMSDFPGIETKWKDDRVALFGEEGYWPTHRTARDSAGEYDFYAEGDEIEFDMVVSAHLPDGEAAIFQYAGFEKQRYVTGYASAVNNKGERLDVSIDQIYEMVKDQWGVDTTEASY